jgi:hypothetical protein
MLAFVAKSDCENADRNPDAACHGEIFLGSPAIICDRI